MKIISQLFVFSNLFCASLAHGLNSEALINRFKSFMEPENLYSKRSMSPLDDLFGNTVVLKRSSEHDLEHALKAADRSFFQQLGNVLTAPFKHDF